MIDTRLLDVFYREGRENERADTLAFVERYLSAYEAHGALADVTADDLCGDLRAGEHVGARFDTGDDEAVPCVVTCERCGETIQPDRAATAEAVAATIREHADVCVRGLA